MPDDLRLQLRLTADAQGFVGEVRASRAEIDKLTATVGKSGTANRSSRATFRTLGAEVKRIGGAVVAAADQFTEINNRLRLVTESERELIAARADLFGISQATRTELGANVALFSRLALASENLGRSQNEVLRVVDILNKQVAIGGSNASEATAGLTQFAQGLASGRLQGDKLRSVLGNLQGVSQGLIQGFAVLRARGQIDFDVTRGNIRELAAEGRLSAALLLDAILASGQKTDELFSRVDETIAGAATKVDNAFINMVGQLDRAIQFSGTLVSGLNRVADVLNVLSSLPAADSVDAEVERINGLRESIDRLRASLKLLPPIPYVLAARFFAEVQALELNFESVHAAEAQFRNFLLRQSTDPTLFSGPRGNAGGGGFISQTFTPPAEAPPGGETQSAGERYLAQLERRLQASQKLTEVERARYALENSELRLLTQFEKERALELAKQIDAQRAAEDAARETSKALDEEFKYLENIFDKFEQMDEARAERHQSAVERINAAAISILPPFERARAQIEAFRTQELADLDRSAEGYEALAAKVEEVYNVRIAEARKADAERRRADAEQALADSTRFSDGVRRALQDYASEATHAAKLAENATRSGLDAMSEGLANFATTGKFNFKDFAQSVISDLARIAARAAILRIFSSAFGSFGGGGGGYGFSTAGNQLPGLHAIAHEGGIVGEIARHRRASPEVFAGAPRLHGGGIAGDEVPAILRRGEEVLPADHPRHRSNAGSSVVVNQSFDFRNADPSSEARLRAEAGRIREETVASVLNELQTNRRFIAASGRA